MLKALLASLSPALLVAALAGAPLVASAQAAASTAAPAAIKGDAGGPAWRDLTAQQRQNLAPLERDWPGIDGAGKAKWLEVSSRFASMPTEERQRVQERMAEWTHLTPAERGRARLSFQEKKSLTPEQKQQRWEAYQALPEDHRRALTAKGSTGDDRKRSAGSTAVPPEGPGAKRPAPPAVSASRPAVKPVSPSTVQARPGATTTLITEPAAPPPHQLPGQARIAAKPGQVDNKTLLPKSGPQAAAAPKP